MASSNRFDHHDNLEDNDDRHDNIMITMIMIIFQFLPNLENDWDDNEHDIEIIMMKIIKIMIIKIMIFMITMIIHISVLANPGECSGNRSTILQLGLTITIQGMMT